MAAIGYREPQLLQAPPQNEPDVQPFIVSSGSINRGDIVTLSSGKIVQGTTNVSSAIVGMALHGSADVYFTGVGGNAAVTDSALFGATTATTSLQPGNEINGVKVALGHNGQLFVLSIVQAKATSQIGTTFGLNLDSTSTFFVADSSQSNKVLTLVGFLEGPGNGATGDTGARGIFQFISSTLAL